MRNQQHLLIRKKREDGMDERSEKQKFFWDSFHRPNYLFIRVGLKKKKHREKLWVNS